MGKTILIQIRLLTKMKSHEIKAFCRIEDGDIQFNYEHMIFTKVGHESYTKVMCIHVCRAKTRGAFSFSKSVGE